MYSCSNTSECVPEDIISVDLKSVGFRNPSEAITTCNLFLLQKYCLEKLKIKWYCSVSYVICQLQLLVVADCEVVTYDYYLYIS